MKRYIKLPSRKTEYRLKNGFSLAEAMVMLVVIAILLAVSAPLIAKKSNADQRRIAVIGNNSSIFVAQGRDQIFNIGASGNPEQEKFRINGKSKIEGTLGFVNNMTNKEGFFFKEGSFTNHNHENKEGATIYYKANDSTDNILISVDKEGVTNIEVPIPDYSKIYTCKSGTKYKPNKNGYLYIKDASKDFKIYANCNTGTNPETETTSPIEIDMEIKTQDSKFKSFPSLITVSAKTCFKCNTSDNCYFMPLTTATTNIED